MRHPQGSKSLESCMMGQAAAEDQQKLLVHAVLQAWPGADAVSQFKRAAASVLLSQPQQTARTHTIASLLHKQGLSKRQLGVDSETSSIFEADPLFRRGPASEGWQLDITALRRAFEAADYKRQQQSAALSAVHAGAGASGPQQQAQHDWRQQQQQQRHHRWPDHEPYAANNHHSRQHQQHQQQRRPGASHWAGAAANGSAAAEAPAGPWQLLPPLPTARLSELSLQPHNRHQQRPQWQQQQQPQLQLSCPFSAAKPWLTALSRLMQRELLPVWQEEDRQYAAYQQQQQQRGGLSNKALKSSKRRSKKPRLGRQERQAPRGPIAWVPGGIVGGDDDEDLATAAAAAAAGRLEVQDEAAAAREAAEAAAAQAAAAGQWGAAHSLMAKMGYRPGQGLGREGQGIKQPVLALHNKRKRGLGFATAGQENDEQLEAEEAQQQQQPQPQPQQQPQQEWHDWQRRLQQQQQQQLLP